jgi:serine protease Do
MRLYPGLFFTALLLPLYPVLAGETDWQEAIDNVRSQVALIEYYEPYDSPEALVDKGRTKRYLTGVLVDASGLIITSSDIFRASLEFSPVSAYYNDALAPKEIRVKWDDEEYKPAEFIGKDDDRGLAFIRLKDSPKAAPLPFEAKHGLHLGSRVLLVQHLPEEYGAELVINERRISAAISRPQQKFMCELNVNALVPFGIALNEKGKAIGLLQPSRVSGDSGNDYWQLAEIIPYEVFSELIKNPPLYREKETARKKWLGIYMQPFTRRLARYYGYEGLKGVLVNTVLKDSPAEKAGMRIGDIITAINSREIAVEKDNDLDVFRKLIRGQKDARVHFSVFRKGQVLSMQVTLGETPISQFLAEEVSDETSGFSVKELTQDIITVKQLEPDAEGVWVSKVETAGWADVAGLGIGDLILRINDRPLTGLAGMREALQQIRSAKPPYISLFVKRASATGFLFIKTNFDNTETKP